MLHGRYLAYLDEVDDGLHMHQASILQTPEVNGRSR